MKKASVNHKRITAVVRQELPYIIRKAAEYERERNPELAEIILRDTLPGIEFDKVGNIRREFVTINDEFLTFVGYDGNLNGFLADYFGSDFKPVEGQELKFRFIGGYLINSFNHQTL